MADGMLTPLAEGSRFGIHPDLAGWKFCLPGPAWLPFAGVILDLPTATASSTLRSNQLKYDDTTPTKLGTSGRATGKVRWYPPAGSVGVAGGQPGWSCVRDSEMDGGSLMDSERISKARAALAAFPGLASVAVVEHGAGLAEECLLAYVVPAGPGLDLPEVHAYARKTLDDGCMPAAILVVDEIPVTAAGAVDAAALPVPELTGLLPYQAPATPRQELLCELFAQVLGVARCGVTGDFFDLGGRSVEAMLLAGRINAALGVRMTMADLFKAPTVTDLDHRLDQMTEART
jgi:hypothetical protein